MSESVTLKVPALKPLTTPLQLKEATVRDYTRAAERAGVRVDAAEIERQAVADCHIHDNVQSASIPRPTQTPEQLAEVRAIRKAQLEAEAQAMGATTQIDPRKVRRRLVKEIHRKSSPLERWSLAKGRVAQICRGICKASDIKIATSTCEIPALAYEIYRIRANFVVRHRMPRPGDEPNPFFGLSDIDCGRLLQRLVEDVCDRSTGRLGPWRTPR